MKYLTAAATIAGIAFLLILAVSDRTAERQAEFAHLKFVGDKNL